MTFGSDCAHPPAPRPAIRLGVIGHRPNKLDSAHYGALEGRIRDILAAIEGALSKVRAQYPDAFAAHASPTLRLITSLAAGTDILAARNANQFDSVRLNVVVPFDRAEFAEDLRLETESTAGQSVDWLAEYERALASATSVFELETPDEVDNEDARTAAYESAGQVIVETADILVAVWDGKQACGRGGTGALVAYAQDAGIPVIHISADAGITTIHSWVQTPYPCHKGESGVSELEVHLNAIVDALIAPPLSDQQTKSRTPHSHAAIDRGLCLYFREYWHKRSWLGWYRLFLNIFGGQRLRAFPIGFPSLQERCAADWTDYLDNIGATDPEPNGDHDRNVETSISGYIEELRYRWMWADRGGRRRAAHLPRLPRPPAEPGRARGALP